MTAPTVFISYSHDSEEHGDRVLALADRLRREGIDASLDQYEDSPPEGWQGWMDRHVRESDFVLMVCTETYYRRVLRKERPGAGRGVKWEGNLIYIHLYEAEANRRFIPVVFGDGSLEHIPDPLRSATHYRVDTKRGYEDLYRRLTDQPGTPKPALGKPQSLASRRRKQQFSTAVVAPAQRVSIAQLPATGEHLFGRDDELKLLDEAWDNSATNVISLVAFGGVGKSALVNYWLGQMAQNQYRGAERVYAISFYSQGSREAVTSADQLIDAALRWFGDEDPTSGSPWGKGERLARLVKRDKTLLVLDGLEPLQQPPGPDGGRLKEHTLTALVRELAASNEGLCVITTRQEVEDLKQFGRSTAPVTELEHLSDKAGAQLLRVLGVEGRDSELEQASHEFGGHGLALNLLGTYLHDVAGGDVRRWREVDLLEQDEEQGGQALRVMASYEKRLGEGPALAVLRLVGLFDRPAPGEQVRVLRRPPAIPALTDTLANLSDTQWRRALARLRQARLLSEADPQSDDLDAHPLVREHFGQRLREESPDAWREGHSRLYEHLRDSTKKFPDTIEEMAPLYSAVSHGCQAGRHQETFDDVYYRRIQRDGRTNYSFAQLGAVGADTSALSWFFSPPWSHPADGLNESDKAFVLGAAGFRLRALGRLREAVQPLQAGLEARIEQEQWENAAIAASNLSDLHLIMGETGEAVDYARQAVELADRSGDQFQQMASRVRLAQSLHQTGRIAEAEALFEEAEKIQQEFQPGFPILYSLQGYQYCDLLIDQGKYDEVRERTAQTLEWVTREQLLLAMALDHVALGRASLLQAKRDDRRDFAEARNHLDQAVEGLRRAGIQAFIAHGLLARAALYRVSGNFDQAQRDLEEAMAIAERGSMRLYEADARLEYARLHLATGEGDSARQSLDATRNMIAEMGYHRRDGEVQELEQRLAAQGA